MVGQGISAARQSGLTLVELLVVMAILAFAASLVALNAPPLRSPAKEEAERFAARARAAWEDSVIDGRAASIAIETDAYRIERFDGDAWRLENAGRRFAERRMPDGVAMLAEAFDPAAANEARADDDEAKPVRIVLEPIGVTGPFKVEFRDGRERWIVRNLADETITVARDDGR